MRWVLRAKIHKAVVSEANINYVGSITIDKSLLEKADFWPYEKVLVVSNTSGHRLETYVIEGKEDSGLVCMNGAAAHLIQKGEEIIIMAFEQTSIPIDPIEILVDSNNRFVKYLRSH
ncbi:MAG: aspartate 1-decarboxylase [Pleurocapsa sp. MO_192.B19]|nr:aspartate 1-decarboxylase [Pleurocapsa sp. MO_192.B19]